MQGQAGQSESLSDDDADRIRHMVMEFVDDQSGTSALSVGADMTKIRFAFNCLRDLVWKTREDAQKGGLARCCTEWFTMCRAGFNVHR